MERLFLAAARCPTRQQFWTAETTVSESDLSFHLRLLQGARRGSLQDPREAQSKQESAIAAQKLLPPERLAHLSAALSRQCAQSQSDGSTRNADVDDLFLLEGFDRACLGQLSGYHAHRAHQVVPVVSAARAQGLSRFSDADRASRAARNQQLKHALANTFGERVAHESIVGQF